MQNSLLMGQGRVKIINDGMTFENLEFIQTSARKLYAANDTDDGGYE